MSDCSSRLSWPALLVPLAAFLITEIMPLDEPVQIGLILPSAAAGAPFLPKLA